LKKIQSYLDLCLEIELLKSEIRIMRAQKRKIETQINKYGSPDLYKSPQYHEEKIDIKYKQPPSLETLWNRYEEIDREIKQKEKELKALERRKKNIDKIINQMDSVKHKVAVLREMQGKSLAEIADELGYSESHIKRLSAEITQEIYQEK